MFTLVLLWTAFGVGVSLVRHGRSLDGGGVQCIRLQPSVRLVIEEHVVDGDVVTQTGALPRSPRGAGRLPVTGVVRSVLVGRRQSRTVVVSDDDFRRKFAGSRHQHHVRLHRKHFGDVDVGRLG